MRVNDIDTSARFFLALLSSTGFAITEQECTSVDLRAPKMPMHGAPTFHQKSSDYCWAFTGTQLASAIVSKKNLKDFNYPIDDVTLSPSITLANSRIGDCRTPCSLVDEVLSTRKACSYQDVVFSEEGKNFHADTGDSMDRKELCRNRRLGIDQLEREVAEIDDYFLKELAQMKSKLPYLATVLSQKNENLKTPERQRALSRFLERKIATGLNIRELTNASMAPDCMNLEDVRSPFKGSPHLNQVLGSVKANQVTCTSFRTDKFEQVLVDENNCPRVPASQKMESSSLVQKINDAFSSGQNYPVGIDYCYTFLYDGETSEGPQLCQYKDGSETSDHKSILIARRFNKASNKCEFLLRNSLGKKCDRLHPNFRKSCEEEARKHNTADVWLSEDILKHSVHGLSVLQDR